MPDDNSVSLRDYVDQAIRNLEEQNLKTEKFLVDNISDMRVTILKAIEDIEKRNNLALDKALIALNARLENMNEFRNQINSERLTYVTRDLLDATIDGIRRDKNLNTQNTTANWIAVISAIGAIALAVIAIIKP